MAIREPAVAGTFYPSEASEIRTFAEKYLVSEKPETDIAAVLMPHAGYVYSGPTACRVLSRIRVPDTVLLIGPNHRGFGHPLALDPSEAWETPLGRVPLDTGFSRDLQQQCPSIVFDGDAHRFEHSLEVEVPLLQLCHPEVKIVPLSVGSLTLEEAQEAAAQLGRFLRTRPVPLILISSDMNHYESDAATRIKDRHALQALKEVDAEGLIRAARQHRISMCGLLPAYMLLRMKEALKIKQGIEVDYETSASVSGDYQRVVGYAGILFRR